MLNMNIKSKNILYIVSSVAIFLVASTWLYIIKEQRVGVYVGILSLSVLSSGYIVNPNTKYKFIIDLLAIIGILFFIGLVVLNFLSTYGIF